MVRKTPHWPDHHSGALSAIKAAATRRFPAGGLPLWLWLIFAIVLVVMLLAFPRVLALIALAVLITGVVALRHNSPTWLRLRSRAVAGTVTAAAGAVLVVAGLASVTPPPQPAPTAADAPTFVDGGEDVSVAPAPTPSSSWREETVVELVPFAEVTNEDPNLPRGQTQTSPGQNGEKTVVYRVTYVDGQEVGRSIVSETLTKAPVDAVTLVGTYDVPPAPLVEENTSGCDPNYADGCVPIASDVDCAGGSGNGPEYFDGVARVVGADIYDLDRDGDGYACEP